MIAGSSLLRKQPKLGGNAGWLKCAVVSVTAEK